MSSSTTSLGNICSKIHKLSLYEPILNEPSGSEKSTPATLIRTLEESATKILPGMLEIDNSTQIATVNLYMECTQDEAVDELFKALSNTINSTVVSIHCDAMTGSIFKSLTQHLSGKITKLFFSGAELDLQKEKVTHFVNTLPKLTDISFSEAPTTNAKTILEIILQKGDVLTGLDLSGCTAVEDKDLSSILLFCPRLQRLSLAKCVSCTEQGLIGSLSPKFITLKELDLSECNVTDNFFKELPGSAKLEVVSIRDCHTLTPSAVRSIVRKTGQSLHTFDISNTTILARQLFAVLKEITLKNIIIRGLKDFSDSSVEDFVKHFSEIQRLDLRETSVSYQGITKLLSICKRLTMLKYDPPSNPEILDKIPETQMFFYFSDKHCGMPAADALRLGNSYFEKTVKTKQKIFKLKEWAERFELQSLYDKCAAWLVGTGHTVEAKTFQNGQAYEELFNDEETLQTPLERNITTTLKFSNLEDVLSSTQDIIAGTLEEFQAAFSIIKHTYPYISEEADYCTIRGTQKTIDSIDQRIIQIITSKMKIRVTFAELETIESHFLQCITNSQLILEIDSSNTLTDYDLRELRNQALKIEEIQIRNCPLISYCGWIQAVYASPGTVSISYDTLATLGSVAHLTHLQELQMLLKTLLSEKKAEFLRQCIENLTLTKENTPFLLEFAYRNRLDALVERILNHYNELFSSSLLVKAQKNDCFELTFFPASFKYSQEVPLDDIMQFLKHLKQISALFTVAFGPKAFYLESQKEFLSQLDCIGSKVQKVIIAYPDQMNNAEQIVEWLKRFPMLLYIDLNNFPFTIEKLIDVVEEGPGIFELRLDNCQSIPGKDFPTLLQHENMNNLQSLSLSSHKTLKDDEILAICRHRPSIKKIDLSGITTITDTILMHIDMLLPNLCSLTLDCTNVRLYDFPLLSKLSHLSLKMCENISDKSLLEIAKQNRPSLESLNLFANSQITINGLLPLVESAKLKNLVLAGCKSITTENIETLIPHLSALETLDIRGCSSIDKNKILHLKEKLAQSCREAQIVQIVYDQ